jgi:hypothetical protein
MVIDCPGHLTTTPAVPGQWRERQIPAFDEPGVRVPRYGEDV